VSLDDRQRLLKSHSISKAIKKQKEDRQGVTKDREMFAQIGNEINELAF